MYGFRTMSPASGPFYLPRQSSRNDLNHDGCCNSGKVLELQTQAAKLTDDPKPWGAKSMVELQRGRVRYRVLPNLGSGEHHHKSIVRRGSRSVATNVCGCGARKVVIRDSNRAISRQRHSFSQHSRQ